MRLICPLSCLFPPIYPDDSPRTVSVLEIQHHKRACNLDGWKTTYWLRISNTFNLDLISSFEIQADIIYFTIIDI